MYGMVNRAIQDMVCSMHGEEMWERMKDHAGIDDEMFISNQQYPDEVTYKLVAAASELSKTPPPQILEAFGRHWVLKTAREGYGELMNAGGATLREFLVNLPNFHTRVVMIYPELRPPTFEITDQQDRSLQLHYHTHRSGLASFVVGLVQGLGEMFSTRVEITLIKSREQGADHDVFLVEW